MRYYAFAHLSQTDFDFSVLNASQARATGVLPDVIRRPEFTSLKCDFLMPSIKTLKQQMQSQKKPLNRQFMKSQSIDLKRKFQTWYNKLVLFF